MSDLERKVRKILDGIDREDSTPKGWWETSTGAQFGQARLNEVVEAVRGYQPDDVRCPLDFGCIFCDDSYIHIGKVYYLQGRRVRIVRNGSDTHLKANELIGRIKINGWNMIPETSKADGYCEEGYIGGVPPGKYFRMVELTWEDKQY